MLKPGTRCYPWPAPVPDGRYLGPDGAAVQVVSSFWTYADAEDRDWAEGVQEEYVKVRYSDNRECTVKAVGLFPVPDSPDSDAAKALLKQFVRYQLSTHPYARTGYLTDCEECDGGLMLRAAAPVHWWDGVPWFVEYLLKGDAALLDKTKAWAAKLIHNTEQRGIL